MEKEGSSATNAMAMDSFQSTELAGLSQNNPMGLITSTRELEMDALDFGMMDYHLPDPHDSKDQAMARPYPDIHGTRIGAQVFSIPSGQIPDTVSTESRNFYVTHTPNQSFMNPGAHAITDAALFSSHTPSAGFPATPKEKVNMNLIDQCSSDKSPNHFTSLIANVGSQVLKTSPRPRRVASLSSRSKDSRVTKVKGDKNRQKFKCDISFPDLTHCTHSFGTQNDLDRHRRTKHKVLKEGEAYYVCPESFNCTQGLNTRKDNFRTHLRNKHAIILESKDSKIDEYRRYWVNPKPEPAIPLNDSAAFFGISESAFENTDIHWQMHDTTSKRDAIPQQGDAGDPLNLEGLDQLNMDFPMVDGHELSQLMDTPFFISNWHDPLPSFLSSQNHSSSHPAGQELESSCAGGNSSFGEHITPVVSMDTLAMNDAGAQTAKAGDEAQSPVSLVSSVNPAELVCSSSHLLPSHSRVGHSAIDQLTSGLGTASESTRLSEPNLVADTAQGLSATEPEPSPGIQSTLSVPSDVLLLLSSPDAAQQRECLSSKGNFQYTDIIPDDDEDDSGSDKKEDSTQTVLKLISNLSPSDQQNIIRHLASKQMDKTRAPRQTRTSAKSPSRLNPEAASESNSSNTPRMWTCDFCKNSYVRQSVLKKHIRRHMKPYPCVQGGCDRSFGSKSDWKRHDAQVHRDRWCFRPSQQITEAGSEGGPKDKAMNIYDKTNSLHDFWCGFCRKEISNENFYTHIEKEVVGGRIYSSSDWVTKAQFNSNDRKTRK